MKKEIFPISLLSFPIIGIFTSRSLEILILFSFSRWQSFFKSWIVLIVDLPKLSHGVIPVFSRSLRVFISVFCLSLTILRHLHNLIQVPPFYSFDRFGYVIKTKCHIQSQERNFQISYLVFIKAFHFSYQYSVCRYLPFSQN